MANYRAGTAGTGVTHAIRADTLPDDVINDPRLTFNAMCGWPVTVDPSTSFRTAPRPCRRCTARVRAADRAERTAAKPCTRGA